MARLDRPLAARAALGALALSACTVFNGKAYPVDGASPDASADAAPPPDGSAGCGCSATPGALCEDFEGSAWGSEWSVAGGTVTRDTSRARCGHASLHVQSPAFGAQSSTVAGLQESASFGDAKLASGFYARAWVYLPSAPALAGDNYFSLMEIRQDSGDFLGIGLQVSSARAIITNWTTSPNDTAPTSAPIPKGAWTCVQWHVAYGAGNGGASTAWIGDPSTPAASLTGTNTAPSPPYSVLILGAYLGSNAQPQPAFELWVDDFVLDASPIGCDS